MVGEAVNLRFIPMREDISTPALGDILAERIMQCGGAGAVTDGGIRDAATVSEVGLPVFAAGPAALASLTAHTPIDFGLPVGCGGVAVIPGDIIVGDGVVVIPKDLADEVARDGVEQEGIEVFIKLQVEKGRSTIGL